MYIPWRRLFYVNRGATLLLYMSGSQTASQYGIRNVSGGSTNYSSQSGILSNFWQHPSSSSYITLQCDARLCSLTLHDPDTSFFTTFLTNIKFFSGGYTSDGTFLFTTSTDEVKLELRQLGSGSVTSSVVASLGCISRPSMHPFFRSQSAALAGSPPKLVLVLPRITATVLIEGESTERNTTQMARNSPQWLLGSSVNKVVVLQDNLAESVTPTSFSVKPPGRVINPILSAGNCTCAGPAVGGWRTVDTFSSPGLLTSMTFPSFGERVVLITEDTNVMKNLFSGSSFPLFATTAAGPHPGGQIPLLYFPGFDPLVGSVMNVFDGASMVSPAASMLPYPFLLGSVF
jgi:hypothetical protein